MTWVALGGNLFPPVFSTATSRARTLSLPTRSQILETNLARVRTRIQTAVRAAGRDPGEVRLVAVTKSVDAVTTLDLARLGAVELGENRTDRLAAKAEAVSSSDPAIGAAVRWHMIGHLQRNKARDAAQYAHAVHSVDTPRLLATLARLSEELQRELDVYLEVELTQITTRSGFAPEQVRDLLDKPFETGRLRLCGLMTMAAPDPQARPGELHTQDPARLTFAQLRELAARLPSERFEGARAALSMGMSDDLEAAVAEGAHVLRVGSALFDGLREPPAPGSNP